CSGSRCSVSWPRSRGSTRAWASPPTSRGRTTRWRCCCSCWSCRCSRSSSRRWARRCRGAMSSRPMRSRSRRPGPRTCAPRCSSCTRTTRPRSRPIRSSSSSTTPTRRPPKGWRGWPAPGARR
ncbi:MAG: Uncharacterized integral membrane endopeptidase Bmul_2226, partial [uncultured Ramlibacter sp.]